MLRPAITAATTLLASAILSICVAAISHAIESGDPVKGKKIFTRCAACHSLEPNVNKIGPSLHGIIGRGAGAIDGFKYSEAMKNSGVTWDIETLDKYLANPKKFVPGNKMIFPGLPKPTDRADIISYLQEAAGAAQ